MPNIVGIAGLGWLGKPFAQKLMIKGFLIKGTVTSIEKASALQSNGFDAYPLMISETGVSGEVQGFLKNLDFLVIMIPPGLRRNSGADYVAKMSHFKNEIEKAKVPKLILVSSTSVYDDEQGKVTEKKVPRPSSQAGLQLLEVEQLFFNAPNLQTTIVRFGGLYGGSRQPVKYLSGRENLTGGNAPVNLIHRDDCIAILSEIITQNAFSYIINAVSPQHPLKKIYYTQQAIKLGIEPPHFSEDDLQTTYKQVDSKNLKAILRYEFKHSLIIESEE